MSKAKVGDQRSLDVTVDSWAKRLAEEGTLSTRFQGRHAVVLSILSRHTRPDVVAKAVAAVARGRVDHAELILAGHGAEDAAPTGAAPTQVLPELLEVENGSNLSEVIGRFDNLGAWVRRFPRLESTSVPLHPSRDAHLVTLSGRSFVALRWSRSSLAERQANQRTIQRLVSKIGDRTPLRVRTQQALVVDDDDVSCWAFADNLGTTLEDELRRGGLTLETRRDVVGTLAAIRGALLDEGLVWQGFAPRNMFLNDGEIVLIDFEEVVDMSHAPERASACLAWHRVFFADSLTTAEKDGVFSERPDFKEMVAGHAVMEADAFEYELLGRSRITWAERRALLAGSEDLEGRHRRPSRARDGGTLFGHQLGHFWGDFLEPALEARLFAVLRTCRCDIELTACLEVLEVAMEADICDHLLRLALRGDEDAETIHTQAVLGQLLRLGPSVVAGLRHDFANDWYRELEVDPSWLADRLIHVAEGRGRVGERAGSLLLGDESWRKHHEESISEAVRLGMDFVHRGQLGEPFLHHRPPELLRGLIASAIPSEGTDLSSLLDELERGVIRHSVAQSHPDYLAFPDSGNSVAALAASVLTRFLNQNLIAVDRSAPIATFVEIQVIEWLRELVGYKATALGDMTGVRDVGGLWATGGHLANHLAMLVALGRRFPEVRRRGLVGMDERPSIVMSGPIAHYSHSDAAFHLGLGWDAVEHVGATPHGTTDPKAVDAALSHPADGATPFMVVGVAGNCRTTGLDDLNALADVCEKHGVWFHVDACHGGSLLFSDHLRREYLAGIHRAHSVSIDPHKGLFTPYPSSYVLFRDRGVLNQFSRHEKLVSQPGVWDLGLITPFLGSRGFESLATYLMMRHVGVASLGELVEQRQAHVRYLERRVDASGIFVRLNDVDFYRSVFVLCPPGLRERIRQWPAERRRRAARVISRWTSRLNTDLYEAGEVCFDEHTLADLGDRAGTGHGTVLTVMAACPGNPMLSTDDLDRALSHLVERATRVLPGMLAELMGNCAGPESSRGVGGPAGWSDV